MKFVRRLSVLLTGAAAATMITVVPASAAIDLPAGMTASYLLVDRVTGATTARDEHRQYRSASIVKLFIALDYLESHGPDYVIPAADLALLQPMLRSSNDDAASTLWVRDGWEQIVVRMIARIGLTDTAPPASRGKWGYTAISAADVVKTYQYILTQAHPRHRDFIMNNLRLATKCASDRFDQFFGIPGAMPGPWAVKQGWSAFGAGPAPGTECVPSRRGRPVGVSQEVRDAMAQINGAAGRVATNAAAADIDLTSPAMHTTGTIGEGDRKIMVVLTLEPAGMSWQDSATRITDLTRAVHAGSGLA
jgi:hypothetical protein